MANTIEVLKGLTKASRALEKHSNRPGSLFPKSTGNIDAKKTQGQFVLDKILSDPNHVVIKDLESGSFKIYSADGKGVYFREDGSFRGFVERQYE